MGRVCNRAGRASLTRDVGHQSQSVAVELLGGHPLGGNPTALGLRRELVLTVVHLLLCDVFGDHVDFPSMVFLT